MPEILSFSYDEFEQYYPLWQLWTSVDKKPTEFIAALRLPARMLKIFFEIDNLTEIMARKYAKDKQEK